ncbi:hypothetical protein [Nocardia terpenica]|uniref:Uncharacterized protein n=1 Tax=Nocardia terpenica TaxID=455432 RepID=A0A6G9ZEQ3_9NOCA|nr:hypothetical protein [Nocardia terpenica]QIS23473.1 hypothetical protein F6W96_39390 [Nocardia terpenica]
MTASWEIENLVGTRVTGACAVELGIIDQVFDDDVTGARKWALVRGPALPDGRDHIVPLSTTNMVNGICCLPYTLQQVATAPSLSTADRHITSQLAATLRTHYGIGVITSTSTAGSSAEK